MLLFVIGFLVGALVAVLVAAPLWLPWPASARWLVATQSLCPLGVDSVWPGTLVAFTPVVIVDVAVAARTITLRGHELVNDVPVRAFELMREAPGVGEIATVEGWCAARTLLLMWNAAPEQVCLYGPGTNVANLRVVSDVPASRRH
jgi:hypothetical protein